MGQGSTGEPYGEEGTPSSIGGVTIGQPAQGVVGSPETGNNRFKRDDRISHNPKRIMLSIINDAFHIAIRVAARSILIQQGPMTGSDLVRAMGLDPKRHKGTVHAVLVDLETRRQLGATRNDRTKKRDLWFAIAPRKRDRIAAAILG